MQTPRLDDVITRVVAWHNRHPLARRIQATQVHSIGEVVLPFASDRAPARAAAESVPPPAAQTAPPSPASLAAVVLARAAARPATPVWAQPPAPAEGPADDAGVDLSLPAAAVPTDRPMSDADPQVLPTLDAALADNAAVDPGPGGWLARLRLRLAGSQSALPRLEAAFGRDFLWPLTPRQVARWAQRQGQWQPLAPADWPRRWVAPDPARQAALRQQGRVHAVPLHLLTAAIGVDDRRLRVLIGRSGQVIGPRAYSRPRLALAVAFGVSTLLAAAMPWWPMLPADSAGTAAALAAPAVAVAASDMAVAAPEAPAEPARTAPEPDPALAVADPPGPTPAPVPAPGTAASEPPPTSGPAAEPAAGPPASIRPQLSAEERQAARQQAERLRGQAAPIAPTPDAELAAAVAGPVYAVVSRPSPQREAAASGLVLMQAAGARLPPPAPAHVELMQTGGEWRAAWWPFASLVDAERARVMLAGRGLKAEVVEF